MAEQRKMHNREISIDISPEEVLGTYANLVIISHSTSEFVLDFARMVPGVETAKVVRRVIMTPDHAKRLHLALEQNIQRFEDEFGEIELVEQGMQSPPPAGFSAPQAPQA